MPPDVTLLQFPAHSPELNPIENLWHYLKSHFWSNRAYDDHNALEQAAITAWRTGVLNSKLMASVCAVSDLKRASL